MQSSKKLFGAFVGMFLLAGCTPAGPRALLEGKRLLEDHKYSQAVERLKTASSILSTNAQVWNYLGVAFHHAGNLVEATNSYQRALFLNRDLSEVHYNLGCLLLEQGKTNEAKNEFTAFVLRRPGYSDGWVRLGFAQVRARDWLAAEKSFGEALRLSPQNARALNGLGVVRSQRNRAVEAAEFFARALKEQPGFRPAMLNSAVIAQQNFKDYPAALQKYRAYLGLKPEPADAEAVRNVVRDLEKELNVPARPPVTNPPARAANPTAPSPGPAKTAQTEVARLDTAPTSETPPVVPKPAPPAPTSAAPAVPVENVKLSADPVVRAAEDVAPATSAPPQHVAPEPAPAPSPPKTAESAPPKRGFFQRINPLNVFHSDAKSQPGTTPLPKGASTNAAGQTVTNSAPARYVYTPAIKLAPGNRAEAQRFFSQGLQLHQNRKLSEAVKAYHQATQADPSFFEAHYNLGLAASEDGELQVALTAYENALAVRPESLDARYNFALLLKQGNYLVDAASEFEKLLTAYPGDTRAHLALGNLYAQQLHQPALARAHYLKVLEAEPRHPQASAIRYWLNSNPQ